MRKEDTYCLICMSSLIRGNSNVVGCLCAIKSAQVTLVTFYNLPDIVIFYHPFVDDCSILGQVTFLPLLFPPFRSPLTQMSTLKGWHGGLLGEAPKEEPRRLTPKGTIDTCHAVASLLSLI